MNSSGLKFSTFAAAYAGFGARTAAWLATDTYPHLIPLSPSDALLARRKSIHDLTWHPARDYNYLYPPAETWTVSCDG
jgi:hypothetical protein